MFVACCLVSGVCLVLFASSRPILGQTAFPSSAIVSTIQAEPALINIDEEILYIDEDGKICAIDPENIGGSDITWKTIWCSPTDGFHDFATGDFDVDGDAEIVGIKNVGSGQNESGRVIVYDPVVSSDDVSPSDWTEEGIPWRELVTRSVEHPLITVEAGNLDNNLPGDEILYVTRTSDSTSSVVILKADSPRPDGTGWGIHVNEVFTWVWTFVAIGNVDNRGSDEIVLIGERQTTTSQANSSVLAAYRVDNAELDNKEHFLEFPSTNFAWQMARIGEINGLVSLEKEIIAINDSSEPLRDNIHIFQFQYDETQNRIIESRSNNVGEFVSPSADALFLADVSGIVNSIQDKEALFLRAVPDDSSKPRFFMRGDDQDGIDIDRFDLTLDPDNGWNNGAGGDIDGDIKDELILTRDDKIRIYTEPDVNLTFIEFSGLTLGKEQIKSANLDAKGYREASEIQATVTGLENGLLAGQRGELQIELGSSGPSVPFSARVLSRPNWLIDLQPSSGKTPATLTVKVDAKGLQAATYSTNLEINSTDPYVRNTPIIMNLELTVLSRGLSITPANASLIVYPCPSSPATGSTELEIRSTTAISYTAFIFDPPTVSAALEPLEGPIHAAQIQADQWLQLSDRFGNSAQLSLDQKQMERIRAQRQSQARIPWFSSVPWLSAQSDSGWTNDTLTLTIDNRTLQGAERIASTATLFIVADNKIVPAPYNTYNIPVRYLCAQTQIYQPITFRNIGEVFTAAP
ncbi:hypothetical protein KFU94_12585 [Chloroflexi bacterium TSY]|nr:hypothetical protein [Chloroflexi bacterium TSY]